MINPQQTDSDQLDEASVHYEQELDPAKASLCWQVLLDCTNNTSHIDSVLDIGCGEGRFLDVAKQAGLRTAGVEISQRAARIAEDKGHLVINQSIVDCPVPDGLRFDVVTMWDILEHLRSPGRVLQHAAAALNPGGYLLVLTPMMGSVYDRLGVPLCKITAGRFDKLVEMCWGHDHLFRYHPDGLRKVLEGMSFRQIRAKPVLLLSLGSDAYAGGNLSPSWTGLVWLDRLISRLGVRVARLCRLHNKVLIQARRGRNG